MTERIEAQIERFAPGFRRRILARHVMDPAALQRHNPNLLGGDINGGEATLKQMVIPPHGRRIALCHATAGRLSLLLLDTTGRRRARHVRLSRGPCRVGSISDMNDRLPDLNRRSLVAAPRGSPCVAPSRSCRIAPSRWGSQRMPPSIKANFSVGNSWMTLLHYQADAMRHHRLGEVGVDLLHGGVDVLRRHEDTHLEARVRSPRNQLNGSIYSQYALLVHRID